MAERTELNDLNNIKSNSYSSREKDKKMDKVIDNSEKKVNKVGTGRSQKMRKSIGRRFVDTFFGDGEDIKDVKTYVVYDVLVPAIKDTIVEGINSAVSMLFFGEVRRNRSSGGHGGGSRVNYGSYFNGGSSKRETMPSYKKSNVSSGFDNLMKDNRGEAEEIVTQMEEILDQYGQVTVADYYDLFGESTDFTNNKYGWTDLSDVKIRRVPRAFYDEDARRYCDGFLVEMPREMALGK